jgi:tetratricopeptide (TPR) repeat protein
MQTTSLRRQAVRRLFRVCSALAVATLLGAPLVRVAVAAGGDPVPEPTRSPGGERSSASAEARYNEGLALIKKHEWGAAEEAFRGAIAVRKDFPEAWNELGHVLKRERRFEEAVAAYHEALRLRPDYAQALEYLGEAYVAMGQLDQARATLAKLEPLDDALGRQLASAIAGNTRRASRW